ncbi:MAG: glycoside hydrolase family 38 C-terminal domain-containing protein [Kiritimatiellae bacterium]|nr:glycoside hydrolase family 38 C-terminal domain-containing protein [Kiritimatiellia bacterium]
MQCHLDPVWLWEWEEGAAEAVSTFRAAAELCESHAGFVFNHNEVILYEWVREHEPDLFKRIQRLVKAGRWHIMGGWYLQPDCNMPCGESFVRQIMMGRAYFRRHFGVAPSTAINFDPFGHTRGLVQILAKSGFNAYLFCRPGQADCQLPANTFVWEGYDGSRVLGHRMFSYPSGLGKAREKIVNCLKEHPEDDPLLVPWGVGNHGGGPSRQDLAAIAAFRGERSDLDIEHATPEQFFAAVRKQRRALPLHAGDLNGWAWGCYTSQSRIKQQHRQLENAIFMTEKMAAAAWVHGLLPYPTEELREAARDLATAQFHDILPGSAIQPVEEMALRVMNHGAEIVSRLRARTFFALAAGQKRAPAGSTAILVYNPHPFAVEADVECEFQLADQNLSGTFTNVTVTGPRAALPHGSKGAGRGGDGACDLPTQVEKEESHVDLDWRKRVVFRARLAPSQMNRFDCRLTVLPRRPPRRLTAGGGKIRFRSEHLDVVINTRTGLLDRYRVDGRDALSAGAACPLVIADTPDPWSMLQKSFRRVVGRFRPLNGAAAARFCGVGAPTLPAVRVIEEGAARVVVEAVMGWGESKLVQRYLLPRHGTEIGIDLRVFWNEKDKMLKLSLPTPDADSAYRGQVAFGADDLRSDGTEVVAQKWTAVVSQRHDQALTIINAGTYGSDFLRGEARLSLLRSAAYSAHPIGGPVRMPPDRFRPRIDQGERQFRFYLDAGAARTRFAAVDREALVHNETPMALPFYPSGAGRLTAPLAQLADEIVQVSAIKRAERGRALIVRLYEPTGRARTTMLRLPGLKTSRKVALRGFEVKTLRFDLTTRRWTEVGLTENR